MRDRLSDINKDSAVATEKFALVTENLRVGGKTDISICRLGLHLLHCVGQPFFPDLICLDNV